MNPLHKILNEQLKARIAQAKEKLATLRKEMEQATEECIKGLEDIPTEKLDTEMLHEALITSFLQKNGHDTEKLDDETFRLLTLLAAAMTLLAKERRKTIGHVPSVTTTTNSAAPAVESLMRDHFGA